MRQKWVTRLVVTMGSVLVLASLAFAFVRA
jgi:hypothetical protein